MATPQHEMEDFLLAVVQRQTDVWDAYFEDSMIALSSFDHKYRVGVHLASYPCDVRKDFIQKVRLADISSLVIQSIAVVDYEFQRHLWGDSSELHDGHATLIEDTAEIIKALQATPIVEESNVIGHGESQNGQAVCLMEATGSNTHQIQLNNCILTDIKIYGFLPPQKLKAVCSLISAPSSTVKSVFIDTLKFFKDGKTSQCMVFEEMLSTQKGGSCQALETLNFQGAFMWDDTSVEHLGEFLVILC